MAKQKVTKEQLEEVLKGIENYTEPRIVKIANQVREILKTMKPGEVGYVELT